MLVDFKLRCLYIMYLDLKVFSSTYTKCISFVTFDINLEKQHSNVKFRGLRRNICQKVVDD